MSEPKNRLASAIAIQALRTGMLTRASELVGPTRLAAALDIQDRSLRAKLSSDRGVTDADLRLAAGALERRAEASIAQVRAIRAHLAQVPEEETQRLSQELEHALALRRRNRTERQAAARRGVATKFQHRMEGLIR